MARQPKLTIAVGNKGIGKTYTTYQMLKEYVRGNPKTGFKGRKVLIFDVNDEFSEVRTMSLRYVPVFTAHDKIEARRITPKKDDGKQMSTNEMQVALSFILENFYGGLLLVEDINRYTSDSIKNDLIGTLATQRHHNLDIVIHFQSKSKAGNPKLLGMCNLLRIHRTNDYFEKHKDKYTDHIQILKIAELLVYNENKKRDKDKQWFYVYVDFDTTTIRGEFTKEQFINAVDDYISQHEREELRPIMAKKDENGKTRYNYQEAFKLVREELVNEYY